MQRFLWIMTGLWLFMPAYAGTPGLIEIYQLSFKNDPEFRAAAGNFRAIREIKTQSIGALLPSVKATGETSRHNEDAVTTSFGTSGRFEFDTDTYTLELRQPLFRMDLFMRVGQARAQVSQAEAEYNVAHQSLIVNVAERYFEVLAAWDNLEFARGDKAAIEQQLQQVRARYSAGVAPLTDLREVEASHDLSVAQEIAAEARLATAEEGLRERTGEYHKALRRLRPEIPLIAPAGRLEDWTQLVVAQNFRLIAAHSAAATAAKEISRQRAAHYPMLDIVGTQSATVSGGGRLGYSDVKDRAVALQLTLPLFEGGQVLSRTREAAERYVEASEREEKQRRAVVRAAADSYRNVVSNISRVKALAQSLVSTEAALKAIQVGYRAGTRTTLDVLEAQRIQLRARRDYAIERYQYIVNGLRLKEAVGTLSQTDVEALTGWFE